MLQLGEQHRTSCVQPDGAVESNRNIIEMRGAESVKNYAYQNEFSQILHGDTCPPRSLYWEAICAKKIVTWGV